VVGYLAISLARSENEPHYYTTTSRGICPKNAADRHGEAVVKFFE
jgi:hypothetical protein